jgi:hypothetical protein
MASTARSGRVQNSRFPRRRSTFWPVNVLHIPAIIDVSTGRVIGVVDEAAADRTVHPGAVYLHQGDQWLVDEYNPVEHHALVHQDLPGYWTQPQSASTVRILREEGGHLEGHRVPHIIGDFVATQIPNNLLCQFYLPARHISGTTIATSLLPKDSHRRR